MWVHSYVCMHSTLCVSGCILSVDGTAACHCAAVCSYCCIALWKALSENVTAIKDCTLHALCALFLLH